MADVDDIQAEVAQMRLILAAWLRERRAELQQPGHSGGGASSPDAEEAEDYSDMFGDL